MKGHKVGFIGCGEIARVHAHCLKEIGVEIGGGYDISEQAIATFTSVFGGKKFKSPGELISSDLDTVYICTRHDSHLKYIQMVAENKKNIFCEKPVALNLEDAQRAKEIVINSGVRFVIGFNHRFSPGVKALRDKLKTEPVPDIVNFSFVTAPFLGGWTVTKEQGGGVLVCLGSHVYDLVNYLLRDEVKDVKLQALRQKSGARFLEDVFAAILVTAKGSLVTVSAHDRGNEVYSINPGKNLSRIDVYCGGKVFQVKGLGELKAFDQDKVYSEEWEYEFYHSWGYFELNERFIEYIDGEEVEIPNIIDGVRAAELVELSIVKRKEEV